MLKEETGFITFLPNCTFSIEFADIQAPTKDILFLSQDLARARVCACARLDRDFVVGPCFASCHGPRICGVAEFESAGESVQACMGILGGSEENSQKSLSTLKL